jgi:hypothetical protein
VASVLACSVAAGGLAACGGASGTRPSATQPTPQQRLVAATTRFARCARARGVPVPDPDVTGEIPGAEGLQRKYQNTPQGRAVLQGCERELTAMQALEQANDAVRRSEMLRFARCMRAHGVPLPDPGPNGDSGGTPTKIDKRSPQVRTAEAACEDLLPSRGAGR